MVENVANRIGELLATLERKVEFDSEGRLLIGDQRIFEQIKQSYKRAGDAKLGRLANPRCQEINNFCNPKEKGGTPPSSE